MGTVLGVVIHVTAGEGDPFNEFANPNNQVSSHFGIGNGQGGMGDGALEQYVDTLDDSWAQAAGNSSYLSVETEGEPTDPLTTNQILTFARLLVWMHQTYGFPLTIIDTPGQQGFITHGDGGVAWGNHIGCPGPQRTAERAAIVFIADQVLNPPAPSPAPEVPDMQMFAYDPATGGVAGTDANGDGFGMEGAPYPGGLNAHPDWLAGEAESAGQNPCVGITYWGKPGQADGFILWTQPAGGKGGIPGTPYSAYRFSRGGVANGVLTEVPTRATA